MLNNILEEYLVSLGFKVDSNSLSQAESAMHSAEGFMKRFAGGAVAQFAVATTAVTAFVVAANVALGKFMGELAQNDLEMEKWARAMFTTKENAVVLNNAIKAMGVTMQDLYLSPELLENFNKLRKESIQLLPPEEYGNQMKFIRSIMFEFQRFKLEVTYALQWVGYYLFKYLEKPLQDIKLSFKGFNDMFAKNMPEWTKKIAQFLSWFVRLGAAAWMAGKTIVDIFEQLPKHLIVAGGALMGFFALMRMGPIGWLIAGLTALLLLIDDYTTYSKGGKAAFGGLWDSLKDIGTLAETKKDIIEIGKSLDDVMKALEKVYNFFLKGREIDIINGGLSGINTILQNIAIALETIVSPFDTIAKKFDELSKAWKEFKGAGGFSALFGELGKTPGITKDWQDFQKAGGFSALWDTFTKPKNYVMPQAYHGSINTSQTNNFTIYGSGDSGATAMAVSRQIPTNIMIRNNGRVIM